MVCRRQRRELGAGLEGRATANWDSVAGIGIQGESLPYDDQYLDLDPTYRDRFGFPLLRLTFDWHENDYNLIRYLSPKMREILERMGAKNIQTQEELTPYSDRSVPEHAQHWRRDHGHRSQATRSPTSTDRSGTRRTSS